MFRTARKNLWAHKLRLALTALAVVLGVAFMAGTLVLTSTLKRNIDSLFTQSAANYTAVVRATTPYSVSNAGPGGGGGGGFGGNTRPLTPDTVLATVRSAPGVAAADGVVQGEVSLVDNKGKAVKPKSGAPTLAIGWVPDHQLSQFKLRTGRAPAKDGEMVIDANTAKNDHVGIGTTLTVDSNVVPEKFTIVGTFGFGSSSTIAGATITAFDTATAQRLVGKAGSYQQVDVLATPGTQTDTLLNTLGARIPNGYEAISSTTAANQMASQVNTFISKFNTFLLVFAFIALFVGAFLIFNTFSILVGQRTRELALFRALGASRRQVTGSVVIEALLTGLIGSIIGILLGVLLATGLLSFLRSFLSLSSSGLVLTAGTVILALLVGTVITVLSALGPAVRSSRVPPVAAMRDDVVIAESSLRRRAIIGTVVLVIGLISLTTGLSGSTIGLVGLGAALTFLGVAVLLPFIAGPLARLIGAPLKVRGITGRLSQENSARNPRRTAATSAALMIGLAVVAAIATLASSATASFGALFTSTVKADYVIVTNNGEFSKQVEPVIRSAPGVVAISPFTEVQFHIGKAAHVMAALDPVTGPQLADIHIATGSTSALAAGEILVDTNVAKSDHYAVGTKIPMGFGSTGVHTYTVGGTYKPNQLFDSYLGPISIATANANQPVDEAILIKVSNASPATQAALTKAIADYPQLSVKTAAQYVNAQKNQITGFLRFVYVLLAFSILIALIGVVNTLVLSVLERTHEIGLLRAIGMVRRQVRTMIRGEAVVVAVLGAVLGLVLGVGFGAAIVSALSSSGIGTLVIPWPTIIVVLVLALLFGIFAAIFPARRAARLDVLRAISAT